MENYWTYPDVAFSLKIRLVSAKLKTSGRLNPNLIAQTPIKHFSQFLDIFPQIFQGSMRPHAPPWARVTGRA